MLSMSEILSYIEYELGASHAEVLELTQFDMIETIKKRTLPVFSKYYPHFENIIVEKSDEVKPGSGIYHLKTDLKIFGVSKVLPWGTDLAGRLDTRIFQDPVDNYVMNSAEGLLRTPTTFNFIPGTNKVEVFPKDYGYDKLLVQVKVMHPSHLKTIPDGLLEVFQELALCDVCIGLKAIRSKFTNISTIYGNIELDQSLFDDARGNRKDLLEKIKSNYYKDARRKKIWVI